MQIIAVDILEEISKAVSEKMELSIGKKIYFMYGKWEEIIDNLYEITKSQTASNSKYPLIAVILNIKERIGSAGGYYGKIIIPWIVIGTITDNKLKAPQRKNINFTPILYPIFYEFIKQIKKHKSVVAITEPIKKEDDYYLGSQPLGQKLNDYVDAITIEGLELTFQKDC